MLRWTPLVLLAPGCAGSGLTYDNEDALGEIPPAEAPVERDDLTESPYESTAGENNATGEPGETLPPPEDPADPAQPPADPGPVDPGGCPAGVICVDTLPYTESNTTAGAPAQLDGYSCAPNTSEAGGEVVYQVQISEPGFLAVTLWGMSGSTDVDAHLLASLDTGDCIDRGHWDTASLLQPGTYYVVADSWTNASGVPQEGDYSIRFHHTPFDAYASEGLDPSVFEYSLTAFSNAWQEGETTKLVYTIADFSMPSYERRLWMIDLADGDLLFHEYVTHGSGSGDPNDAAMVAAMSNINGSHMSSLGLMRAAETYYGSKGYSMRLDGLESGYNDLVRPRAIVFHGADYATEAFVNANGYLGRSWGCPAVDHAVNAGIIDTITGGGLYMSFFDEPDWLANSVWL